MAGSVVDDTIGGSSCLISILLTFNTMLNLCHPLTFLLICFLRLRLSLHYPGVLWLLINCTIGICQFFVMSSFTFRHFKNNISHKKLTVCSSLSFYLFFAIQLCSMIVGSAKYRKWSNIGTHKFHSIYLVYMILSWSFLGALIIVTMICMIIYLVRTKRASGSRNRVVVVAIRMERKSVVVAVAIAVLDTKWIRIGSVSTIHVAAITAVLVVSTVVVFPEGVTEADIVYASPSHRIIYQPDPNAPVTMSNHPPTSESFEGLAGVGTLGNRHYVPAVFYSDLNNTAVRLNDRDHL
ncbi:hypothetical protein JH06_4115 [Blastocystis sp. subtype 4]|uniref:hypothetical protein n=1 Tax=Blastocystis sp. subtype 4 TaxID=944170 RepID=UPI0007120A08|nr:hypothetical protein JH06_4115 [Blastocystis sp. subtype 4]KNB43634.1 hypothetical protein JH06_4115 [Blastocystis sp. subtype 4]|eukprot:XP_014527077.1 hypothetical protein JH06_4115 [Blastocystis sp. subtype 4]